MDLVKMTKRGGMFLGHGPWWQHVVGFHKWWVPQNGKMVGLQAKIRVKWMMTRGTPIYGNPHMKFSDEFLGKKCIQV